MVEWGLLLYRFRFVVIIIGVIGTGIILHIAIDLFDSLNNFLNYSLNWLRLVIEVTIFSSGIYAIIYWYDKKWGEAGEHYKQGVNLIKQGKGGFIESTEILSEFEEAIKKNSYFWQAYFYIANIYYLCKEYDKALEYIRTVIKLKPKFAPAYLQMGKFLYAKEIEEIEKGIETHQSDLYKEAIEAYKKALKLRLSKEDRLQIHALLSEIYFQLGLMDDGKKELNEVLKIDPNNKIAHDYLNELAKKGFVEKRGRFSFT